MNRLISWLTYNFFFALLPLGASILIHILAGKTVKVAIFNSPEILFFSIMVSATAIGDLSDIADTIGWDVLFKVFRSALLLGAVISAILYGSFLHDRIIGPGSAVFRSQLFRFSLLLSSVIFILSTLVEILIARIEE